MRWWIDGAVGQFRTSASIVWLMPTGRIGMAISKKNRALDDAWGAIGK